jgi:drug/metabolite transporter (DMT)-like permease
VDYLHLLLYASLVSSIILFIILFLQRKIFLFRQYSKTQYLRSAALSACSPFFYYLIIFKAYSLLPAQVAQPLNCTWPVILVRLSSPLLHQKILLRNLLAVLISFCGVVIIGTRGDIASLQFSEPFGVSLALGSSVLWALFWIYNVRDKRDDVVKLFLNFFFAFLFALTATFIFSELRLPSFYGILGVTYVGLFEMSITFVIWLKALKLSETTAMVSSLIFLFPFISLIFIHLILGEPILSSTVVGLVLIVTGILSQRRNRTVNEE